MYIFACFVYCPCEMISFGPSGHLFMNRRAIANSYRFLSTSRVEKAE